METIMQEKHTPGPWAVTHHGEWIIGRSPDIGECLVAKTDGPEWRENARLIAAAPELLDLLKIAVARVEIANAEGNDILSAWLTDAQNAIAKATGETL